VTWLFDRNFNTKCLKKLSMNTITELSLSIEVFECPDCWITMTEDGANSFNLIPNFCRLKYLNLKHVEQVDNDFLKKLSKCCTELEYLNVGDCWRITNHGMTAVSELKNLTTLMMCSLYLVTDVVLRKFEFLKVLFCNNCDKFTEAGIIQFLQNAPYLEKINLRGIKITKEVLDVAYNVAISRGNEIPLKIIVSSESKSNWVQPSRYLPESFIIEVDDWEFNMDDSNLSYRIEFDD
ncbi:hypothetical protein PV325_013795, partial [Microctonus aethiopoides]